MIKGLKISGAGKWDRERNKKKNRKHKINGTSEFSYFTPNFKNIFEKKNSKPKTLTKAWYFQKIKQQKWKTKTTWVNKQHLQPNLSSCFNKNLHFHNHVHILHTLALLHLPNFAIHGNIWFEKILNLKRLGHLYLIVDFSTKNPTIYLKVV